MSAKPRISPHNGFFRCDGSGVSGFGYTAAHAYAQWQTMLNPPKPGAVTLGVMSPDAQLPPGWLRAKASAPAPIRRDVAMLEALRRWEPDQAH